MRHKTTTLSVLGQERKAKGNVPVEYVPLAIIS